MAGTLSYPTDTYLLKKGREMDINRENMKMMRYVAKYVVGGADTYATNGIPIDIRKNPKEVLIEVEPAFCSSGFIFQYDKTNKKIKVYGDSNPGTVSAFTELPNTSALIQSVTFEFVVMSKQGAF